MLNIASWMSQKLRRAGGGFLGKLTIALVAAASALAQTPLPTVQFTANRYTVDENDGSARITVSRLGDRNTAFSVVFTASDNTAISGQHYIARTGILNFGTNEMQKTFDLVILDNGQTNATRTVNLSLSNVQGGAALGFPRNAALDILDDETGASGLSAGSIGFSTTAYWAHDSEGFDGVDALYPGARDPNNAEGIVVTVVRTGGARGAVLVDYQTVPAPQTWIGPQATEGVQYTPVSGTLILQDYQMSTEFVIPTIKYVNFFSDAFFNAQCVTTNVSNIWVMPDNPESPGFGFCPATDPTYFPFLVLLSNLSEVFYFHYEPTNRMGFEAGFGLGLTPTFNFQVRLSNVRPAPGEDPQVIAPTLNANRSVADCGVVVVDNFKNPDGSISASLPTSNGFSLERARYTTSEAGQNYAVIMVNRDARIIGSTFVRYWVNNANAATIPGDHQLRTFPLYPGSDYAHPFADYLPPGTDVWGEATGNTNQVEGRIDWSQTEFGPKPIVIPIVRDNLVEFNEDMFVQLFLFDSEFGDPAPRPAPPAIGPFSMSPTRTRLTIRFDNIYDWIQTTNGWRGAEQPAGAVDRRYNRDNESYVRPPFNLQPGANAPVLAVAVQPDGRLIVGGEFRAVNTFPRNRIARMTPEGQIDDSFVVGTGANEAVTAIALQADGKVVIGGQFTSYNGVARSGLARLNADGTLDASFNPGLGANRPVRALALQSDGRILIGGEFTSFNGTNRNYIARLNSNGSLDTTYSNAGGPNEAVYAISIGSQPKIIDQNDRNVDRVFERHDTYDTGSTEGTMILDYNLGGAPDTIVVSMGGQILQTIGPAAGAGSVTIPYGPGLSSYVTISMNPGQARQDYLADWSYRLNVFPRTDDRPIIGGRFTAVDGVPRNRVARLTLNGTLDTTFDPGFAAEDGIVYAVAKHGRKAYVGGTFSFFDRFRRGRIVGLNEDGKVDLGFDPGTGFNDIVYSIVVDPAGKPIMGGLFTEFNTSRRVSMARLKWTGKLDTTFMDTAYNQFAGLPNTFSFEPENFVRAMTMLRTTNSYSLTVTNVDDQGVTNVVVRTFIRNEDQLFIGGSFERVGGGFARDDMRPRHNFARVIGGFTEGPGLVEFSNDAFSADEHSGSVFITVHRDDGHLGATSARFDAVNLEQGPGAATKQADFLAPLISSQSWPSNYRDSRQVSEAFRGPNNEEYFVSYQDPGTFWLLFFRSLVVPIIEDTEQEGDEQVELTLAANPITITLGGEPIPSWPALGRSSARLTIVDNDFNPGVLGFTDTSEPGQVQVQPVFFVNENQLFATITLTRTNGSAGEVSVDYRTRTGGTATPWDPISRVGDYDPISIGTVSFAAGETNRSFTIRIREDTIGELDESVLLELLNPTGGATLGAGRATLLIIDNDFAPGRLSFKAPVFTVNEAAGSVNIVVQRTGGSLGTEQVQVSTFDGTDQNAAIAGRDYIGVTNVVLTWGNGDTTNRIVTVPIINGDIVDGTRRFRVVLSNPRVNGISDPNAIGNQREAFVDILDDDAFGNLRFSQGAYSVDENGTNATITLVRVGGFSGDVSVNYTATPELAIPGEDFQPVSGTLIFTNGQTAASFNVPIFDDPIVDGTKTVILNLSGQTNDVFNTRQPGTLAAPSQNVVLTIVDNELENSPAGSLDSSFLAEGANDFVYTLALQSDGRILVGGDFTAVNSVTRRRLARLDADGTVDASFFAGEGPSGSVRVIRAQDDGRILIGGSFTNVAGTNRNYIARLFANGQVDQTFDPGPGANNPIYAMLIQPDGKTIIGGDFSAYGSIPRNGIARVETNGVLDVSFNPGNGASGTPGFTVYALAQQLDGKILVGGDFTTFNNISAGRLVRLRTDGSVDPTFQTSVGANGSVRAIAVQADGKILVGGLFTQIQGVPANRIARLNQDGSVDTTFNNSPGIPAALRGASGPVGAIAIQIDGKIVLGGDFAAYNGVTRRGITRLLSDGQNDPTINFGSGVNGSVAALVIQPDRKIVLAGGFTEYDGQRRERIARINGGSMGGSGRLQFERAVYTISEAGNPEVLITIRRTGGTTGSLTVNYTTQTDPAVPAENSAVAGVDYVATSGQATFGEGETFASFKVPIRDDTVVEPEKIFQVALTGLPESTIGDQPTAQVVITSDDSEVRFQSPAFSVGESIASAAAAITVVRTGSVSDPVSVTVYTVDGTATSPADYGGITNVVSFAVGESERIVSIAINPDLLVEGNEFVNLYITNVTTGGIIRPGVDSARLTIVDDDFAAGEIRFERPNYSVREGNVVAQIAVIRTNGVTGVASVDYRTTAITASPGLDYVDRTGIITFQDGEALKFIEITIIDDDDVENNEGVAIDISNVRGGASLGLANATLTIIDDDLGAGSVDDSFNIGVGANGPIRAIELDPSDRFLIGGDFTAFNNDGTRSRIARLLQSGSPDPAFSTNAHPNNSVTSLALQPDTRIILGGAFSGIDGTLARRVARLHPDGLVDTSFNLPLGLDGQVSSVAIQPDGKVVIGGVFTGASAANRNRIARLHPNGTLDTTFDPGTGADNPVNVVVLQQNAGVTKILIGGAFNTVNGIGAGRIARLNPNGSVDTTFRTGTGFSRGDGRAPMVYDIALLDNGHILVAGDFTAYNGIPRAGIAVLDAVGTLQGFGSGLNSINGAIRAVAVQRTDRNSDNKILIGGDFTLIDGTPRNRVARLDAAGNFDPSFDPGDGADDSVLGIVVQPWDGRVVVVGAFREFNNNPNLRGIARLNNDKKFLPADQTPIVIGSATLSAGALNITFDGAVGQTYVIERTSNFINWVDERTVQGAGPNTTVQIPASSQFQFFRIRRQ